MTKPIYLCLSILFFFCFNQSVLHSQFDRDQSCSVDVNNECVANTLLTAVPFLRINSNARSGAMGDVGIAIASDANSTNINLSNLVFSEQSVGLAVNYTPWLRNLALPDIYLSNVAGYYKLDDKQVVSAFMDYFALGDITFTNINGISDGSGRPHEFSVGLGYARKLGDNLSAGLTGKYIYSNLATGAQVLGIDVKSAKTVAADISLTYNSQISRQNNLTVGLVISDIGPKVSYTDRVDVKDVIPTNLGIGTAVSRQLSPHNKITVAIDFNKLLVPTPIPFQIIENTGALAGTVVQNPNFDQNQNGIGDYREQSLLTGIFNSFADAEGGFTEEIQEINYSIGFEYEYNNTFAVRTGYFNEHELKGNRKFLTLGFGIKYTVLSFDFSYLMTATNTRSPLDNTLRFSLIYTGKTS